MLVVIGLIVAFVVLLWLQPWKSRACRWREDRTHDGAQTRFVCVACGVVVLSDGGAPTRCLAGEQ